MRKRGYGVGLLPADGSRYVLRDWLEIMEGREIHAANNSIISAWFTATYLGQKGMPKLEKALIHDQVSSNEDIRRARDRALAIWEEIDRHG